MEIKRILILLLKILLIFILGYYALRSIEIDIFLNELTNYSSVSLLLVIAILFLTDISVSFRWMIISKDKFILSFESTMVAATMNILLPARLGEMAKAIYLKQYYKKSFNRSLSFIIFERFFDVLFLSAGALFVLYFLVDNSLYKSIFISIFAFQLILLFITKSHHKLLLNIIRFFPVRFLRVYIRKITKTISRKMNTTTFVYVVITTLIVWIMNFTVTFTFLHYATGFNLSLTEIFVVFIISGVGFVLPLLPAGALTFQAGYIFALGLYGVSETEALAASLVFHVVYIITMIVPGKLILLYKKRPAETNE